MKLKPLLLLGVAAAGGAAAVVARRSGAKQVAQAIPEPVRNAAQQAVEKVTPAGGGESESSPSEERYEPPAEALAQEPSEPGGAPSDDAPVTQSTRISSLPGDQLNTPEHAPPEGAVMPDTSDDDPLVRQQERAAAGDAGSIGGNVDQLAADDASFADDQAVRPVVEGAGDDNEETFETREGVERGNRETDV